MELDRRHAATRDRMFLLTLVFTLIFFNTTFALPPPTGTLSGPLFTVTASTTTNVLSIKTNVPQHVYPNAGIKVNTPGFSLQGAGTECIPNSNGYCLFTVSDTVSTSITINGQLVGNYTITLCLNGVGELSCQTYTQAYPSVTVGGQIDVFGGIDTTYNLTNNNGNVLSINVPSGGTSLFTFTNPIPYNGSYNVKIIGQNPPTSQTGIECNINDGSGSNATLDVTTITIACGVPISICSQYDDETLCNNDAQNDCLWVLQGGYCFSNAVTLKKP